MNADRTGPLVPAVFNLMVGAYSLTEMRDRILAAGLADPGVQTMPEPFGSTVLTAGKAC